MTEYIPTPEDDELEATIGRLFDQLENAREDSGILVRMMPCFSTSSGDTPVSRAVRSMLRFDVLDHRFAARLIFLRRDAEWSGRQRDLGDIGQ